MAYGTQEDDLKHPVQPPLYPTDFVFQFASNEHCVL
jgi:hypothetical protein